MYGNTSAQQAYVWVWVSWAHRNKHAQNLHFSRKLQPGHPGSSAVLKGNRTREQKSQTHSVERDPALAPGSLGEKAAPVTVKHSCKERQLPTPAVIQWALWDMHSPMSLMHVLPVEKWNRARGTAPPLRGSFCHIAQLLPPVSSLYSLLRLLTNRCVYIPHCMKSLFVWTRACLPSWQYPGRKCNCRGGGSNSQGQLMWCRALLWLSWVWLLFWVLCSPQPSGFN